MSEELKKFTRDLPERRQLPDRREPGWYDDLVEELDAHADRLEERLHRFYSRALAAFAVMGVACAVALAGFANVLDAQKSTTSLIQSQRYDAIMESCLDTNVRHDNALAKIDIAADKVPKKERNPRGVASFKAIIEATVPYTSDCRDFARKRVRGGS